MAWVYLSAAIVLEVTGTVSLRAAVTGSRRWYAVVLAAYVTSFAAVSLALAEGMALGAAYGIWAAVGVALTALASRTLFREPLTPIMGLGILLIAGGVLLVELGRTH